jgi:hypothetical protein
MKRPIDFALGYGSESKKSFKSGLSGIPRWGWAGREIPTFDCCGLVLSAVPARVAEFNKVSVDAANSLCTARPSASILQVLKNCPPWNVSLTRQDAK